MYLRCVLMQLLLQQLHRLHLKYAPFDELADLGDDFNVASAFFFHGDVKLNLVVVEARIGFPGQLHTVKLRKLSACQKEH